jgi:hypothetical protein
MTFFPAPVLSFSLAFAAADEAVVVGPLNLID